MTTLFFILVTWALVSGLNPHIVDLPREQWPVGYNGKSPLYAGTATTWCGAASGNMCGLGAKCDSGSIHCGALSDASFPDVIQCSCSSYCSNCGLTECCNNEAPSCNTKFCGAGWCVACNDAKCYNKNTFNVTLADACPKYHPNNVNNCCSHNKDPGWCECVSSTVSPNIDLNCAAFQYMAAISVGQVEAYLWAC